MIRREEDSARRKRDGHDGTAAGTLGKGARRDRSARGKLQGDAGEIRTRARRIFRHDAPQRARDRAVAVLVVMRGASAVQAKSPGRDAPGFSFSPLTLVSRDDSSGDGSSGGSTGRRNRHTDPGRSRRADHSSSRPRNNRVAMRRSRPPSGHQPPDRTPGPVLRSVRSDAPRPALAPPPQPRPRLRPSPGLPMSFSCPSSIITRLYNASSPNVVTREPAHQRKNGLNFSHEKIFEARNEIAGATLRPRWRGKGTKPRRRLEGCRRGFPRRPEQLGRTCRHGWKFCWMYSDLPASSALRPL